MATASGACWEISAATRLWISPIRRDGCARAGVEIRPWSRARSVEPSAEITPKPVEAVPGSMPSTIIWPQSTGVGGRDRTGVPAAKRLRIMPRYSPLHGDQPPGRAVVVAARAAAGGGILGPGRGRPGDLAGAEARRSAQRRLAAARLRLPGSGDRRVRRQLRPALLRRDRAAGRRRCRGQLQRVQPAACGAGGVGVRAGRRPLRVRDRARRRPRRAAPLRGARGQLSARLHGALRRPRGGRRQAGRGHSHQAGDRLRQHPHAVAPLPAGGRPGRRRVGDPGRRTRLPVLELGVDADRPLRLGQPRGRRDRDRRGRGAGGLPERALRAAVPPRGRANPQPPRARRQGCRSWRRRPARRRCPRARRSGAAACGRRPPPAQPCSWAPGSARRS